MIIQRPVEMNVKHLRQARACACMLPVRLHNDVRTRQTHTHKSIAGVYGNTGDVGKRKR